MIFIDLSWLNYLGIESNVNTAVLLCWQFFFVIFFLFVVDFVIKWNETAMGLHVFPIPIPPPTSLSTRSL